MIRKAMTVKKIMIGVVLGSAIGAILAAAGVSSAMVYHAIVSRHHEDIAAGAPSGQQTPAIPKPPAGAPLNAATNVDQADAANDPNSSDPQSVDSDPDQAPADDQVDAQDSDQETDSLAPAQGSSPVYATPAVRVRPVVRVVHVNHPAVAAAVVAVTAEVDRPVTSAASMTSSKAALLVPVGTSVTIRLSESLGSKTSETDQSFAATLDRDIDINGKTVIAAGAPIIGKVVFARPAGPLTGEANLQLKVTSINVGDHEFDVLTSMQSFGPTVEGKTKFGRFMKGIGKRVDGNEHEVVLEAQTAYTFTLSRALQLQ